MIGKITLGILIITVLGLGLITIKMMNDLNDLRHTIVRSDVLIIPEVKSFVIKRQSDVAKKYRNIDIVNDSISHSISKWSMFFGVPTQTLINIPNVESNFDPKAVGKAGEIGLMQILPKTAMFICDELGFKYEYEKKTNTFIVIDGNKRTNLFDIDLNIRFGAYYIWRLRFWSSWESTALTSYNGSKEYLGKIMGVWKRK